MALRAKWVDGGKEPQCAPDPNFPDGIAIDMSNGAERACETSLRYPAPRIGVHDVSCRVCGFRVQITTAGRPDDPKSVKVACAPVRH